jgi:prevent-host-death family protein
MVEISASELRNDTIRLLRRVELGDEFTITVDGRAVAVLGPIGTRPRWINGSELFLRLSENPPDRDIGQELANLAPDTTDDLPLT